MEDFNIPRTIPIFKDKNVNEIVKQLSQILFAENRNVGKLIAEVCNLRNLIKGKNKVEITDESEYQEEHGQIKIKYDFYDIMLKIFGFKKRTIQKILSCEMFLSYVNGGQISTTISLKNCFKGFSLGKLFELLPLKEKAIEYCEEGFLTSDYTIHELRLKVAGLLGKETTQKDKTINDFDMNAHYTLNDFKTRWTKTELMDIAFSLYTNYRGYIVGKDKDKNKQSKGDENNV